MSLLLPETKRQNRLTRSLLYTIPLVALSYDLLVVEGQDVYVVWGVVLASFLIGWNLCAYGFGADEPRESSDGRRASRQDDLVLTLTPAMFGKDTVRFTIRSGEAVVGWATEEDEGWTFATDPDGRVENRAPTLNDLLFEIRVRMVAATAGSTDE